MASPPSHYSFDNLVNKYLTKGAEVEICSNDEGFRGSFYIGTIIKPVEKTQETSAPQTKGFIPRKLTVLYKTLLDSNMKPLVEEHDAVYVRPLPPVDTFPVKFKFNDAVDAYQNDGWWEGFITAELGNNRFSVYFRNGREQSDFDANQLRIHREWNRQGTWDPPLRLQENEQNEKELGPELSNLRVQEMFSIGKEVEVSSDEEGFAGVWFNARVIEHLPNKRYLIEYERLRNEENTAQLREEAEQRHVRPCPLDDNTKPAQFKVSDQIDAFYKDGWWVGEIFKVHRRGKTYTVFFKLTDEKIEFKHSELRLHQEWINGNWVIP